MRIEVYKLIETLEYFKYKIIYAKMINRIKKNENLLHTMSNHYANRCSDKYFDKCHLMIIYHIFFS